MSHTDAHVVRGITADLSAWYAGASLFVLCSVLAVAIYGFHHAVTRRAVPVNAL